MLRNKTLWLFLLKAALLYGLLSAPVPAFDKAYGDFYRGLAKKVFGKFRETGFVIFSEMKDPAMTHTNLGNYKVPKPDGSFDTAAIDINTRILGYLPTILLISLVIASPVGFRRKMIALALGIFLTMLLILFKHWISLIWLAQQTPWLQLANYTCWKLSVLTFTNTFISSSSFTVAYFVIAIWLLVTFRMEDLKSFIQPVKK